MVGGGGGGGFYCNSGRILDMYFVVGTPALMWSREENVRLKRSDTASVPHAATEITLPLCT